MSVWITYGLIGAAALSLLLAALILTVKRRRIIHLWLSAVLVGVCLWSIGILRFLSATSSDFASISWVKIYYIAGLLIVVGLLEFSYRFPIHRQIPKVLHSILAAVSVCLTVGILANNGLIQAIIVNHHGNNTVMLQRGWYSLYVLVIVICTTASLISLGRGIRFYRHARQMRLQRQILTFFCGAIISLSLGCWFNVLLPLFGDYTLIWIGPIGSILFSIVALYAITRQGLFDLRQALMRSLAYILLVGSLLIIYIALIQIISHLTLALFRANTFDSVTSQFIAVLLLAGTIFPLKNFFDSKTNSLFYRNRYSPSFVIDAIRDVAIHEVRTEHIMRRSLSYIDHAMTPYFMTAIITPREGESDIYSIGTRPASSRQIAIQREIATDQHRTLPVFDVVHPVVDSKIDSIDQRLIDSHVGAYLQLVAQHQIVGMIFVGHKRSGRTYDEEDMRLFSAVSSELGLAVQNSLRYEEIEAFARTLEKRISAATKELQSSNEKLQKLDEAKDEFISMASHQLRTPLTSIKGYIDMVLEGDAGRITEMQRKFLTEAFSSSERMVHIINDFLNVSRLQTGKFMLEKSTVDLKAIITQELDSLKTTADSRGLTLQFRSFSLIPLLSIDENKMRQVIMNFVDNAMYYSKEGTTVRVELSQKDNQIVFEVHDSGIGVPKDEQKELFGKFFRATNARKHRPDGTGVGLYLAKKVVTAHHGQVIFRAPREGGSIFGFSLPIAKLRVLAEQTNDSKDK